MFLTLKTDWDLSTKDTYAFLRQKNIFELSELNPFNLEKSTLSSTLLITDKGFKGTVVNRTLPALPGDLLDMLLTVPNYFVK